MEVRKGLRGVGPGDWDRVEGGAHQGRACPGTDDTAPSVSVTWQGNGAGGMESRPSGTEGKTLTRRGCSDGRARKARLCATGTRKAGQISREPERPPPTASDGNPDVVLPTRHVTVG